MFKKKDKTSTEIKDTSEKVSRRVVKETVETSGGVQTTRTVITTTSGDDLDSALKRFNIDAEDFPNSGTTVTKKVVYSSSGKQVVEQSLQSFSSQSTCDSGSRSEKTYITEKKTESSPGVSVIKETMQHTQDPTKDDSKKGKKDLASTKTGKSFTEKIGLKSSKNPTKSGLKSSKNPTKSAAPSATPASDTTAKSKATFTVQLGNFEDDALQAHNAYREKHGVPTLKLSSELCAYSMEWANHLAAADKFQHRTEGKYGENIYMKWSSDPNHVVAGHDAVDSWYSEIKDHVFGKEPTSLKSGHFTQVIWKKSTELGIAWARSRSGKILVVANYNPAGNFVGTFTENVPPPKRK